MATRLGPPAVRAESIKKSYHYAIGLWVLCWGPKIQTYLEQNTNQNVSEEGERWWIVNPRMTS